MDTLQKADIQAKIRAGILRVEEALKQIPGAMSNDCCPLTHTFVDGAYVREIRMPKGMLLTSKIHKVTHPYFILSGEVSVLTPEGTKRIKAPYYGVTPAGTKRLLYMHKDTVWVTVHVTKEKDLKQIEEEVIANKFQDIGLSVDEIKVLEEDKNALIKFIHSIPEIENKEALCLGLQ